MREHLGLDIGPNGKIRAMAERSGSSIMKELLSMERASVGSALDDVIAAPSSAARDEVILREFQAGNVPPWNANWRPVRVSAVIDGKNYELEYLVTPDYFSLGNAEDYFRAPMTPFAAQKIADKLDAILPSTRMVDEIFANANAKMQPQSISPNLDKPSDYAKHEIMIQKQMKASGISPGIFMAGHKKDIVVGPNLDGSRVAIYGWHDPTGQLTQGKANRPIQPYSTIHESQYADYSHGVRLVRRQAYLNGQQVNIEDVFTDPKLHILVSNQGPFSPKFPNSKVAGPRSSFTDFGSSILDAAKRLTATSTTQSSTNEDIFAAQTLLSNLGFNPGSIDGLFTGQTKSAITAFQAKEGLQPTGTLDVATKEALVRSASAAQEDDGYSPLQIAGYAAAGVAGATMLYFVYKNFKKD